MVIWTKVLAVDREKSLKHKALPQRGSFLSYQKDRKWGEK